MELIDRTEPNAPFVVGIQPEARDKLIFLSEWKVEDRHFMCSKLEDAMRFTEKHKAIQAGEKFRSDWMIRPDQAHTIALLSIAEADRLLRALKTHEDLQK